MHQHGSVAFSTPMNNSRLGCLPQSSHEEHGKDTQQGDALIPSFLPLFMCCNLAMMFTIGKSANPPASHSSCYIWMRGKVLSLLICKRSGDVTLIQASTGTDLFEFRGNSDS